MLRVWGSGMMSCSQQLDSISLSRRDGANFLDFANLADLTLAEPEVFKPSPQRSSS